MAQYGPSEVAGRPDPALVVQNRILRNAGTSVPDNPLFNATDAAVTAAKILELSYAQMHNWRNNPLVLGAELLSLTYYADAAALQAAFPAAAKANKAGYVGTPTNYQIYVSDGTTWTARNEVFAYFRSGIISTTGYQLYRPAEALGLTSGGDFGGVPLQGRMTLLQHGRVAAASGNPGTAPPYTQNTGTLPALMQKDGTTKTTRFGMTRVCSNESQVIARTQMNGTVGFLCVKINGVWRAVSDPTQTIVLTNYSLPRYFSHVTRTGGGTGLVMWDFSKCGSGNGLYEWEYYHHNRTGLGFLLTEVWIRRNRLFCESSVEPITGLWCTDSTGGTSPDAGFENCWPQWANEYLGVKDMMVFSDGSTGFVAEGSSNRKHYDKLTYMATFPQFRRPDVVALVASINDGINYSGIQTEIRACVNFINRTWRYPLILIVGPTAACTVASQADMISVDKMLATFVPSLGLGNVLHVPTMASPTGQPIVGARTCTNPDGTGSSELYFQSSDLSHFILNGHMLWGRNVVAPNIERVLFNYVNGLR